MKDYIENITKQFGIKGTYEPFGNGHINDTYLVISESGKYVLQKINKNVFKNPCQVMDNICLVCEHLKHKTKESLTVLKTLDGKNVYLADNGEYYRMYNFVENAVSYDQAQNLLQVEKAGRGYGEFAKLVSDLPSDKIYETIVNFHNTPSRYNDFLQSVEADVCGRVKTCLEQIEFIKSREKFCHIITDEIEKGTIPLRITHNDTKFNNIMFSKDTDDVVCVVDLDTVMPGSLLYDFGDAIRSAAHSGAEDEADITRFRFDKDIFEAFAKGFLSETGSIMTDKEKELICESAILITFENGIRFLTDYLNGDTYYKIKHPRHNLVRANNQLSYVKQMEDCKEEMKQIISRYI